MKSLLFALKATLLMTGCGVSDNARSNSGEASFNASLIDKCEAYENGISKQTVECPKCRHPNLILIAAAKVRAIEAKKIADVASKQKPKPATTRLDLETVGGEKPKTVIIARHPNASSNGTYRVQEKLVNGYVY